jgi:hypothetical protein
MTTAVAPTAPAPTRRLGQARLYPRETMSELRGWFEASLAERLPQAQLLYWT